jgi:hypothetical protein
MFAIISRRVNLILFSFGLSVESPFQTFTTTTVNKTLAQSALPAALDPSFFSNICLFFHPQHTHTHPTQPPFLLFFFFCRLDWTKCFGLPFTFSRWSLTGFWRRQMKTNNPGVTQPQLNNKNVKCNSQIVTGHLQNVKLNFVFSRSMLLRWKTGKKTKKCLGERLDELRQGAKEPH